jgi:hypothetical protein
MKNLDSEIVNDDPHVYVWSEDTDIIHNAFKQFLNRRMPDDLRSEFTHIKILVVPGETIEYVKRLRLKIKKIYQQVSGDLVEPLEKLIESFDVVIRKYRKKRSK